LDDALADDEVRIVGVREHVAHDGLDGGHAAHVVERIAEVGVGGVQLGGAGDAFRRQRGVPVEQGV
jgi:hypothetical protein